MSEPLSMLERRRIEAAVLKHVYDVLVDEHGTEHAQKVIGDAVSQSAIAQGKTFREQHGARPDLEDFHALLPLWQLEEALKVEVLHVGKERLDFNITRCRYAEMYQEMGLGDIGHLLSCNRDGDFCIGYNDDMTLTRTQTIMKGATHCDFRYQMNTKPEPK